MTNNTRRQWIQERVAVLETSTSPEELELAATDLAFSDDPEALDVLGKFLRQSAFLDRLDEADDPAGDTAHLSRVMLPLIERPSPEVALLCLRLVDEPIYLEHDRKSFVLEAVANVAPMIAETVEAFRRANEEGYFGVDALLLADNGSPAALELFRFMMAEKEVDSESRVELLHKSIMPRRNRLPILQMVAGLMADGLEEPVTIAAIESVFDYQTAWFRIHGPTPPGWRTASDETLRFLIDLGAQAKRRPNLPSQLAEAIDNTVEIARALLARRTP
jgi:hypothetical protein